MLTRRLRGFLVDLEARGRVTGGTQRLTQIPRVAADIEHCLVGTDHVHQEGMTCSRGTLEVKFDVVFGQRHGKDPSSISSTGGNESWQQAGSHRRRRDRLTEARPWPSP